VSEDKAEGYVRYIYYIMDLVAGKFRLRDHVNSGSFGEVFEGLNEQTGTAVAIKVETQSECPQLLHEAKVLRSLEGKVGLPTVFWYGKEEGRCVMVMTLLGKSLEMGLRESREKRLSLKLVLRLGLQMLARVETTHSHSFIHRDIKPDNFVKGRPPAHNRVYLIDFGLAKRYRDDRTKQHTTYAEGRKTAGTARYMSLNTHMGIEQSRRDDLESLIYSLIYLLNGSLPWQGLFFQSQAEKCAKVTAMKRNMPLQAICKGIPHQFCQLLAYCRELQFETAPDYEFIRYLLKEAAAKAEIDVEGPLAFPGAVQRSASHHKLFKKKSKKERKLSRPSLQVSLGSLCRINSDKQSTEELKCDRLPALHPIVRLRLRACSSPTPDFP